MANVGDVCELVPKYTDKYALICIISISESHYRFETEHSYTETCHINSIMAKSFQVIASNVTSLAAFKSTHPEYFV